MIMMMIVFVMMMMMDLLVDYVIKYWPRVVPKRPWRYRDHQYQFVRKNVGNDLLSIGEMMMMMLLRRKKQRRRRKQKKQK
jgi:hypothetical protein